MPTPSFQAPPSTNPYGFSDIGGNSTPSFVDIDNDGDLDAFVGEGDGNINYFKNNGTTTSPSYSLVTGTNNPFNLVDIGINSTPSFVDIDNDGDKDAFIGERDGTFFYYKNNGTAAVPSFSPVTGASNPLNSVDVGNDSSPTFADIDGDGDKDLFSGKSNGDILYYRNTGTATAPSFAAVVTNPFGLVKVSLASIPTVVDIDLDGDLDLFVGEQNGTVTYFQNTGTTTSPSFSSPSVLPFGLTDIGNATAPTFADPNGDGLLDAIYGDSDGNIYVFRNTTPVAPVAVNDTVTTNEDTSVVINILSNDTDANNNISPSTVSLVTAPTKGSYSINSTTGAVTYTPNANYNGTDSFTYKVSDTTGNVSNTATVNITVNSVNDAPVANNDSATTNEDTAVTINVLVNDTDIDGDPRNLSSFTQGANGTVTRNNNGTPANLTDDTLTYTPNANFNGTTSFTYTISDGNGGTSTATVNITATAVNDVPTANNDSATTNEDTAVTISVLSNDTDVDGDPRNLSSFTQGANGTVIRNNNGTPANFADDKLVYTPNANFNGTDSFTYSISDGNGGTSTATVNITVTSVNDAPIANNDSATSNEDTAVTISVLANDTDVDGDPRNLSSFTPGANGTVTRNDNGTPSNLADDTLTYTPNANFNSTDSFTYTISDGNGGTSTATVNLTIDAVNDVPVANSDTATTDEDTTVTIAVLDNDSDVDGDPRNLSSFTQGANGTVTRNDNSTLANLADDTLTYTPNANFNGTDSFTYTIDDGNGGMNTATVDITVVSINDVPIANDDAATTDEDTAVTIAVLANDSDVDSNLNPTSFTQGANGTVTRNDNGTLSDYADDTLTYTPNANFNGTDSFTYTLFDGNDDTSTATVNIMVNSINDVPVATDDTGSVTEGQSIIISPLSNDLDPDIGDSLTIDSLTDPSYGILVANGDGTFTYTANLDYCGSDSFTYSVKDSQNATSNLATVNITVNPYNYDDDDQGNTTPLTGTACPNILNGNGGDDTINGKGGNDTLNGGLGANDRITGGDGDDRITDPDGIGTAYGNAGNDIIDVTFISSWRETSPRSDGKILGGYGDDIITVTMNKSNFFLNMKGDESISGTPLDGDDTVTLLGSYGNSVVDLGGGNDTFTGGVGVDGISGGAGNDLILGMGGSDQLSGQNGNDTLRGGLGSDKLTGGADSDIFVLAAGEGKDTIADFSIAQGDKIGLAGGLQFSDLTFSSSNILFGSQTLATLTNVVTTTLTANDFVTV